MAKILVSRRKLAGILMNLLVLPALFFLIIFALALIDLFSFVFGHGIMSHYSVSTDVLLIFLGLLGLAVCNLGFSWIERGPRRVRG